MPKLSEPIVLILTLGAIVFMLMVYAIVRLTISYRKQLQRNDTTEVAFMVNTFHTMVAQLKEKERELEQLRSRAEQRAVSMEDYNEYILQSVPSGVVSVDEHKRVVKANAQALRLLEIPESELIGRQFEEALARLEGFSFDLGATESGECRYASPKGNSLWLGYTTTALRDATGKSIGHLFVFTDLTELRALEGQARLRQHLASLGEMAAGIAHELRNPLGVISGYMRLLGKSAQESQRAVIDAVNGEVAAMDSIIKDFMSFARPKEPDRAPVELLELARECVGAAVGQRADIAWQVNGPEGFTMKADYVLMRQALMNLSLNAVQALPQGGRIGVDVTEVDGHVTLVIRDTGHGIPEGLRDKVFLPFFTTKDKGTGLGLAIVHRIVTAHGGTLEVDSTRDGTAFTMRIPSRRS